MDCERVVCAAPAYLERHGVPETPGDLMNGHNCLLLRFPGSKEYFWTLSSHEGPVKLNVRGAFDADDADVLTVWALQGAGIVNRPRYEVAEHLASGALTVLLPHAPPLPIRFACLYPHRRLQDPKVQVFIPWMVERCRQRMRELLGV
jgi:DNA-binding transcriptional LysR family regulator